MPDEWITASLLARAPAVADRVGYRELFLDPQVMEWLRPEPLEPFDEDDIAAMLADDREHWNRHGFGPWTLVDRGSGAMVGRGGLRWTEVESRLAVELPWAIGSGHWNRGLATEAAVAAVDWAGSLALPEVVALIRPANVASSRVAQKAGFSDGGHALHAGFDHVVYRYAPDAARRP